MASLVKISVTKQNSCSFYIKFSLSTDKSGSIECEFSYHGCALVAKSIIKRRNMRNNQILNTKYSINEMISILNMVVRIEFE